MIQMTTRDGGPLSLGYIPSCRLKNARDVDDWSSLRICLSIKGMSFMGELRLHLLQSDV